MTWTTPEPAPEQQTRNARERARIAAAIPSGWAAHWNRLTYGLDIVTGPPTYGICQHDHICFLNGGQWRHPYPTVPPVCEDPPPVWHLGLGAW